MSHAKPILLQPNRGLFLCWGDGLLLQLRLAADEAAVLDHDWAAAPATIEITEANRDGIRFRYYLPTIVNLTTFVVRPVSPNARHLSSLKLPANLTRLNLFRSVTETISMQCSDLKRDSLLWLTPVAMAADFASVTFGVCSTPDWQIQQRDSDNMMTAGASPFRDITSGLLKRMQENPEALVAFAQVANTLLRPVDFVAIAEAAILKSKAP